MQAAKIKSKMQDVEYIHNVLIRHLAWMLNARDFSCMLGCTAPAFQAFHHAFESMNYRQLVNISSAEYEVQDIKHR